MSAPTQDPASKASLGAQRQPLHRQTDTEIGMDESRIAECGPFGDTPPVIHMSGVPVSLTDEADTLDIIIKRARNRTATTRPLAVVSVNLDHVFHFGRNGRWEGTLHADPTARGIDWFYTIDGAPIASQARRLTGTSWPRLAGSDLAGPILHRAQSAGLPVAFVGGSAQNQSLLRERLTEDFPKLRVAGMWAPSRDELESPEESQTLAHDIAAAGANMVFVGFGKPRQELWMARYGETTGAAVLLGFGAVVDFLAGRVQRAPRLIAGSGLEWGWRLALEPRRLGNRYLVQGPEAYLRLRRLDGAQRQNELLPVASVEASRTPGRFTAAGVPADVDVIIVTYNNRGHIDALLAGLRAETHNLSVRVHVADNCSSDETIEFIRSQHPDVLAFGTGGNLGYAAAINRGLDNVGDCEAVLVLNPDLDVRPGALQAMLKRLDTSGAGVVVPRLLDPDGMTSRSIFREPSLSTALGDALFGSRWAKRPSWFAGVDYQAEAYAHPRTVRSATGAALLIRADLAKKLSWDESYFLYSEETEFFREVARLRESVWYEPSAHMMHVGGGSASSAQLDALLSVNRVKYIRRHHGAGYARAFRGVVSLDAALRCRQVNQRAVFRALVDERRWRDLPGPTWHAETPDIPTCAVIIPAHNEEAVIGRILEGLRPLLESPEAEVIVSCNGCTDATAMIAGSYAGVTVLESTTASKVSALNAADDIATQWPRIYVDADVEITPRAIVDICSALEDGQALVGRPPVRYEVTGASALIRRFYRTRQNLRSVQRALWAAGVYAISEEGHARFRRFPDVTADDLFVDRLFTDDERVVPPTDPVVFRPPRTLRSQLHVLRRVNRGNAERAQLDGGGATSRKTTGELLWNIRSVASAIDVAAYAGVVLLGRFSNALGSGRWERDESSRQSSIGSPVGT